MPETLSLDDASAAKAGAAAKACKLVAFPTETGYAFGSTGLIKAATRRILQVKERSTLKPLPVMVSSVEEAKKWVEWTPAAEALAAKFWPGPLVLLLKPTAQGRLLTFPEYPTVAIRVPGHAGARAMLAASGVPWVYSSANKSGQKTAATASETADALGSGVDLLLDGGKAGDGEPTFVDATDKPRVTKQGVIKAEDVL
jgi:L-threonylcarbamoyladenylate synthase